MSAYNYQTSKRSYTNNGKYYQGDNYHQQFNRGYTDESYRYSAQKNNDYKNNYYPGGGKRDYANSDQYSSAYTTTIGGTETQYSYQQEKRSYKRHQETQEYYQEEHENYSKLEYRGRQQSYQGAGKKVKHQGDYDEEYGEEGYNNFNEGKKSYNQSSSTFDAHYRNNFKDTQKRYHQGQSTQDDCYYNETTYRKQDDNNYQRPNNYTERVSNNSYIRSKQYPQRSYAEAGVQKQHRHAQNEDYGKEDYYNEEYYDDEQVPESHENKISKRNQFHQTEGQSTFYDDNPEQYQENFEKSGKSQSYQIGATTRGSKISTDYRQAEKVQYRYEAKKSVDSANSEDKSDSQNADYQSQDHKSGSKYALHQDDHYEDCHHNQTNVEDEQAQTMPAQPHRRVFIQKEETEPEDHPAQCRDSRTSSSWTSIEDVADPSTSSLNEVQLDHIQTENKQLIKPQTITPLTKQGAELDQRSISKTQFNSLKPTLHEEQQIGADQKIQTLKEQSCSSQRVPSPTLKFSKVPSLPRLHHHTSSQDEDAKGLIIFNIPEPEFVPLSPFTAKEQSTAPAVPVLSNPARQLIFEDHRHVRTVHQSEQPRIIVKSSYPDQNKQLPQFLEKAQLYLEQTELPQVRQIQLIKPQQMNNFISPDNSRVIVQNSPNRLLNFSNSDQTVHYQLVKSPPPSAQVPLQQFVEFYPTTQHQHDILSPAIRSQLQQQPYSLDVHFNNQLRLSQSESSDHIQAPLSQQYQQQPLPTTIHTSSTIYDSQQFIPTSHYQRHSPYHPPTLVHSQSMPYPGSHYEAEHHYSSPIEQEQQQFIEQMQYPADIYSTATQYSGSSMNTQAEEFIPTNKRIGQASSQQMSQFEQQHSYPNPAVYYDEQTYPLAPPNHPHIYQGGVTPDYQSPAFYPDPQQHHQQRNFSNSSHSSEAFQTNTNMHPYHRYQQIQYIPNQGIYPPPPQTYFSDDLNQNQFSPNRYSNQPGDQQQQFRENGGNRDQIQEMQQYYAIMVQQQQEGYEQQQEEDQELINETFRHIPKHQYGDGQQQNSRSNSQNQQ